ncbi:hypothetical protein B0H19DRAFT_1113218 [Mycena capillaripes]|nr:hypothetical protein B0H19DRAFT_1113218 [Mycena capillaripes]
MLAYGGADGSVGLMVLVRTTPGVVSLWSGLTSVLGWSGHRSLCLCTQNAVHALFVSLFDGWIHVISSLTEEPKLSNISHQTSGDQSISKRDVNRVSGMIPYDGCSVAV